MCFTPACFCCSYIFVSLSSPSCLPCVHPLFFSSFSLLVSLLVSLFQSPLSLSLDRMQDTRVRNSFPPCCMGTRNMALWPFVQPEHVFWIPIESSDEGCWSVMFRHLILKGLYLSTHTRIWSCQPNHVIPPWYTTMFYSPCYITMAYHTFILTMLYHHV